MSRKQTHQIAKLELLLDDIRKKIIFLPTKKMIYKDVTFAQLKVIRFLSNRNNAPMSDIAKALSVTLPTATGLVDNLVHNRYLKRHHERKDRRLVRVELSIKGYKLLKVCSKIQRERFAKIRDSMTSANWKKFIKAVETVDRLLDIR